MEGIVGAVFVHARFFHHKEPARHKDLLHVTLKTNDCPSPKYLLDGLCGRTGDIRFDKVEISGSKYGRIGDVLWKDRALFFIAISYS